MASIFPTLDSTNAKFFAPKTPGERFFLKFALENLSDEWTIFHNLVYGRVEEKNVFGEIDFLLYHEIFGLLAVEIKDGKITCDANEVWQQNGHGLAKDPWTQAASRVRFLHAILEQTFGTNVFAFGVAGIACFPDTNFCAGMFPPDSRSRTIFKNDFDKSFDETLANFLKNANDRETAAFAPLITRDQLRDCLEGLCGIAEKLRDSTADDERTLLKLTQEQGELLRKDTLALRRFRVRGGAGTGKTVIACEMAKRLARKKKKTLLLCHNVLLANDLKRSVQPRAEREKLALTATAFAPLEREKLGLSRVDFASLDDAARDRFFKELPAKFIEHLKKNPEKFDAVIVDEAQDFSEDMWRAVEELLTPESTFVVFYDPGQNLFNATLALPPTLADAKEFLLTKNCRNTRNIFEEIKGEYTENLVPIDGAPDGDSVEKFYPKTDEDAREMLDSVLSKLRKRGVPAGKITIIGARRDITKTPIGDATVLGGFQIFSVENLTAENMVVPRDVVRYCTCMKFKGCETGTLIVLGLDESDARAWSPKTIYTACSRAVARLCIIHAPKKSAA